MATFSDDFNRADGAIGSNWSPEGFWVIDTNRANSFDTPDYTLAVASAGAREITLQGSIVIPAADGAGSGGWRAMWDSGTNSGYYLSVLENDNWYLEMYTDNSPISYTDGNNMATAPNVQHDVVWTILGGEHEVYVDGNLVITWSESTYTSGFAGMQTGHEGTYFDNFSLDYTTAEPPPASEGGTLTPTIWVNKLALEVLTM